MTVYVDELKKYPSGYWCHMACDSDDQTELHELAQKIGLKPEWFQEHTVHPHYDLRGAMRRRAITAGAVAVSSFEFVKKCSKIFRENPELLERLPQ